MDDNKTLRTSHLSRQFAITIMRNGVCKYIDRSFSKNLNCTVCLNSAKRFQSEKQAWNHAKYLRIENRCDVMSVIVEMRLEE